MKKRKANKKGVSPLIATVLLVGFTVSIVALTILWSKGYIEEKAQKEEKLADVKMTCQNIKFGVAKAHQTPQELFIMMENKATQKIDGFAFRIIGDSGMEPVELHQVLNDLERKEIVLGPSEFSMDNVGEINTVDIIPLLKAGKGFYVPCSDQHLEVRTE